MAVINFPYNRVMGPTCTIDGCSRRHQANGLCAAHNRRLRIHGDPNHGGPIRKWTKSTPDTCTIEGCAALHYGNGWCQTHYMRWRRHGDPIATKLNRTHTGTCEVDGCGEQYDAQGMCATHYKRARYAIDPSVSLATSHRRRTRLAAGITFTISGKDRRRLRNTTECLLCHATENLQVDHLIPIARGGIHGIGNLAVMCKSCNSSKRDLTITEWKVSGKPRANLLFRGAA